MSTPVLAPHARITGAQRRKLAAQLAARYEAGESIRQLCTSTGYSIGRVRGLLVSAEVTFRARGGRTHPTPGDSPATGQPADRPSPRGGRR